MRCGRPPLAVLALLGSLAFGGTVARAAGPPQIVAVWASQVTASSAKLSAEVDPGGSSTFYRFEVIAEAAYLANLGAGKDGFSGAARVPEPDKFLGTSAIRVSDQAQSLAAGVAYRYRIVAHSGEGTATGTALRFVTQSLGGGALLPDGRGWEMVSPVDKNGGDVGRPGGIAAGGVLQAAADGQSVTYSSSASFGSGAAGAPYGSQYIARRGGSGWASENITTPMLSGSYGTGADGVPYRLFSPDLARGLLLNGRHCRGEGEGCPVANPPLAGSGAPAGYQNYYLRDSAGGTFAALLAAPALAFTSLAAARFDLSFAGAAPALGHVVLSTCAALTADATEVPAGEGCNAAETNLYEWSNGTLRLVNLLSGKAHGTPGARLAAPSGAISDDGRRVYFSELEDGALYLREEGGPTKLLPETVGGGASFQTASTDGSVAYFTKGSHLWRYEAAGAGSSTDLTPSGGVVGVLGASADGSHVYYLTGAGLFLRDGAVTTKVADAADSGNYPPSIGMARVNADGSRLAFVSTVPLTEYDNTDLTSGEPDSEIYLFDAGAPALICISCNPTNGRPSGPSILSGAIPNGEGPEATDSYRPRALAADGRRLYFESEDGLALADTNGRPDVYQWEVPGEGSCARPSGCLALISSGKGEGPAYFVDASDDGSDVFFLTDRSLVGPDPGSEDLYDARVGGGFPEPPEPIPCEGDSCQVLPSEPVDPPLDTTIPGLGNPKAHYRKLARHHRAHRHRHKRRHGKRTVAAHGQRGRR